MSYNKLMAIDGIILSKVKDDLLTKLPIRINRISETSKTEIVFNIHANNIRSNMVISLHTNNNHLSISNKNFSTYNDPSTFVMVLRKHLINGIIYDINQYDYDRYLIFHIKALNDLYDEKHYLLSIELMGKYVNMILIDKETNKIIDAYKKIPPYENTRRTILQGAIFTLPDKQDKQDFFNTDFVNLDESLVKQFQGFSKTLEKEVRYLLENHSLKEVKELIINSKNLYLTKVNEQYEYHIIPLTNISSNYQVYEINEGFDVLYYELDEKERIKNTTDDINKFVKKEIKHYEIKLSKLNNSLQDSYNLEEDKICGDYLYTYGDLNKKGLAKIVILDKEIKLDPKYSIKDNARKYYNSYQKKRKGQSYIKEQIEIASLELEYFNSVLEQLSISNLKDAMEIKQELYKYGYLKKINKKTISKKINVYKIEFNGHLIYFGKNNTQNNEVTFNYSRKDYTWFHAKDYHGSHVVTDTDNPDETLIRKCANIAAYYSQGRYSSSVPVNYCLVKDIKKIPGAKTGFVSLKNYKTIYIDPVEDKDVIVEV